ncbi:MAG: suppressor of fused domain protein [Deltaproteobacteria bacterium]|nr:suppressor of fused domain protein [Deltaproteobacteria bacterium]
MPATGRAAIEQALADAHPNSTPLVVARSERPLACIVAHAAEHPPHWHLISMGLSDLGESYSGGAMRPQAGRSGWGHELTLRVTRGEALEPPMWALDVLAAEAAGVLQSRCAREHGNAYDVESDVPGVVAVVPIRDSTLPTIHGPTGADRKTEALSSGRRAPPPEANSA